jgi:hypothetical protein
MFDDRITIGDEHFYPNLVKFTVGKKKFLKTNVEKMVEKMKTFIHKRTVLESVKSLELNKGGNGS